MAFDINNFKEVGGNRNFVDGGQVYTIHSATDSLTTMLANGYLNDLSGTLNVRDTIILCGSDFTQVARIATNNGSVITVTIAQVYAPSEVLVDPSEISTVTIITDVITTTGIGAVDLDDGISGQIKIITLVIDGGDFDLQPFGALGYSSINFADAGDTVTLLFAVGGWAITGQGGPGTGPLVT